MPFPASPSSRRAWIEIALLPVITPLLEVALLAEGVDRNFTNTTKTASDWGSPSSRRAWIEISYFFRSSSVSSSPSSRRAWIEIGTLCKGRRSCWSPSSRRAWIEISNKRASVHHELVALLAEGVDRNYSTIR